MDDHHPEVRPATYCCCSRRRGRR